MILVQIIFNLTVRILVFNYILYWSYTSNMDELKPNPYYKPVTDTKKYFIESFSYLDRFRLVAVVRREPLHSSKSPNDVGQEVRIEYLGSDGRLLDGRIISRTHIGISLTILKEPESMPPDVPKEIYFLSGIRNIHLPERSIYAPPSLTSEDPR